jgi:hypothetical protein
MDSTRTANVVGEDKPEYKEVFPNDGEHALSTLTADQVRRAEALIWVRRVLMTQPATSPFTRPGINLPSVGDMVYLAEWIIDGPMAYDDSGEGDVALDIPTHDPGPTTRMIKDTPQA